MFRSFTKILAFGALMMAQAAAAETLILGSISDNVKKHVARTAPIAAYLAEELAEKGITSVEVKVLPNADSMAAALRSGEVDVYFDSPLVAARVAMASGARPILRRWKRGVGTYHSVVFVRAASDIHTLEDLRGQRIAFQEPDSTSGFILPAGMIRSQGLEMVELDTRESVFDPEKIGYVFTMDDKNSLIWIYKGWVEAAATDPQRFEELNKAAPGAFRVIDRSIEVPRQVVMARKGLHPATQRSLIEVLVGMGNDARTQEIMTAFNKTTRFDHFPDGIDATFGPIYDLILVLQEQNIF